MKKILLTGYYKKDNTGDDIFEKVASKLFVNNKFVEYSIISIDQLKKTYEQLKLDTVDSIVLFGGETLNDFFLNTLSLIKTHYQSIKLFAVGVGLGADPDYLKNYIPMFQYIIFRHKSDYEIVKKKFEMVKCQYVQDIAFIYHIDGYLAKPKKTQNVIGLFLSQPKYYSLILNNQKQDEIDLLNSYVSIINGYVEKGYTVKLFSMCHNNIQSESDTILNERIYCVLDKKTKSMVKIISPQYFESNIISLKYAICERFHSHILSLIYNIPFISSGNTYKVAHLLTDLNLQDLSVKTLDFENIYNKLENIDKKRLMNVYKDVYPRVLDFYEKFTHIPTLFEDAPQIQDYPRNKIQLYITPKQIDNFCIRLLNDFNHISKTLKHPADYILIKIFGTNKLEYKWGIEEKIKHKTFTIEDIKWLAEQSLLNYTFLFNVFTTQLHIPVNNHLYPITSIKNNKSRNLDKKSINSFHHSHNISNHYNIDYIDQYDRTGVHRHGWKYVIDNLSNSLCSYQSSLIKCDLYVDRTFHWNREVMIEAGIIPYKTHWIGFIHHTLYQDDSGYNCIQLLKCKEFIESLKVCKGLIVLSNYLKNNLLKLAEMNNIKLPVVHFMYHPTVLVDKSKMWKYGKWKWNSWKGEVIQIGSWMRDIKAIYDLNYKKKFALVGKEMLPQYRSISFGDNQPTFDELSEQEHQVTLIKHVNNDTYDDILSRYVVFLKLKDASAVNTILECISRNTPIVVNRLPAVEEYLGPLYPLYYTNLDDVPRLLKNKKLIVKANTYLKNMNKDFLKIENFINTMKNLHTGL